MTLLNYFVDGHFISAVSDSDAIAEFSNLYGQEPEIVRAWTKRDQVELERIAG